MRHLNENLSHLTQRCVLLSFIRIDGEAVQPHPNRRPATLLQGRQLLVAVVVHSAQIAIGIRVANGLATLEPCFGLDVVNLSGWPEPTLATKAVGALADVAITFENLQPELVPVGAVASGLPALFAPCHD